LLLEALPLFYTVIVKIILTLLKVNAPSISMFNSSIFSLGPGNSVYIAIGYGLDGPWIESRWGARFSTPVQTGPVSYPSPCIMGTESFSGVKCGRGVTLTTHTF